MRGIISAITGVCTSHNICVEEKINSAWERPWNLNRKDKAWAMPEGQVWICHDYDAKKDVSIRRKREIKVTEGQVECGIGGMASVSVLIEQKSLERAGARLLRVFFIMLRYLTVTFRTTGRFLSRQVLTKICV